MTSTTPRDRDRLIERALDGDEEAHAQLTPRERAEVDLELIQRAAHRAAVARGFHR